MKKVFGSSLAIRVFFILTIVFLIILIFLFFRHGIRVRYYDQNIFVIWLASLISTSICIYGFILNYWFYYDFVVTEMFENIYVKLPKKGDCTILLTYKDKNLYIGDNLEHVVPKYTYISRKNACKTLLKRILQKDAQRKSKTFKNLFFVQIYNKNDLFLDTFIIKYIKGDKVKEMNLYKNNKMKALRYYFYLDE